MHANGFDYVRESDTARPPFHLCASLLLWPLSFRLLFDSCGLTAHCVNFAYVYSDDGRRGTRGCWSWVLAAQWLAMHPLSTHITSLMPIACANKCEPIVNRRTAEPFVDNLHNEKLMLLLHGASESRRVHSNDDRGERGKQKQYMRWQRNSKCKFHLCFLLLKHRNQMSVWHNQHILFIIQRKRVCCRRLMKTRTIPIHHIFFFT